MEQLYNGLKSWASNSNYVAGIVLIYSNKLYMPNINHTSTTAFDKDKFTFFDSSSLIPSQSTSTNYRVNEKVYNWIAL